jgi:drug/metabolite transporter (DMT)-like permease
MSLIALVLVLLSALLHATWNLWSKDSADRVAYMWWALVTALVIYTPLVALAVPMTLPVQVLPILVISGLFEAAYVLSLNRAYDRGDLSLVYPVARGSPPLFTAVWAGLLLAERLPPLGYAGIGLLVAGIYAASVVQPSDLLRPIRAWHNPPVRWALVAGLCISLYSVADKAGLRYMPAPAYNVWLFVAIVLCLAPFVWLPRRRAAWEELKREHRRIVSGGVLVMGAYFLVLGAMEQAPVSYVGAVRGAGVLVGAVFGWVFLKERFGLTRVIGAVLIFGGIVCLSFA